MKERGDSKEFLEDVIMKINPEVSNLINYQMEREAVCLNCTCRSDLEPESNNFVSVASNQSNVQDAIDTFFLPEPLDLICHVCAQPNVQLEKTMSDIPKLLVVHNVDGKAKLLDPEILVGTIKYILQGFNIISGPASNRHYVTIRPNRMESGNPYEFNDSVVKAYTPRLDKKLRYYVAIYERDKLADGTQNPSSLSHSAARGEQRLFPNSSESTSKKPSSSKPVTPKGKGPGKRSKKASQTTESTNKGDGNPTKVVETKSTEDEGSSKQLAIEPRADPTPQLNPTVAVDPTPDEGIPTSGPVDNQQKDNANEDFLDDTIEYQVDFDDNGDPIISSYKFKTEEEKEYYYNMSAEQQLIYLYCLKAKDIHAETEIRNRQAKIDAENERLRLLHKFRHTVKQVTVGLVRQNVDDMQRNLQVYLDQQKRMNRKRGKKKTPVKVSTGTKSAGKRKRPNTDATKATAYKPRKKFATKNPESKISTTKLPKEDAKKKIQRIVKEMNRKKEKPKVQRPRKKYTKFGTRRARRGQLHKSFMLKTSFNILPPRQLNQTGNNIECVLCSPRLIIPSHDELIRHYNRTHYKRVIEVDNLTLLMCKCEDFVSRCADSNRNTHHHCTLCWKVCEKTYDLQKHMSSQKDGHNWKFESIKEK